MKIRWQSQERNAARRARVEFEQQVRPLRWRRRIDAIIVTLVTFLVVLLAILLYGGVGAANVQGLLDLAVLEPLADERLLINFRQGITEHPLLDAVFHTPNQRMYVSQQGGLIHKYDPKTGLWGTERPFSSSALYNPDLQLLRSGCGTDATHSFADPCTDRNSVWGLTPDGALVREHNGQWSVVFGDTTFIGARGIPVETADLTTAALSEDGNWLMVGTNADGIGLYDRQTRSWVQLGPEIYTALPALEITHLVWALNHFWIGGPQGVAAVEINNRQPQVIAVQAERGNVRDLDLAFGKLEDPADDRVWVMLTRPCATGGDDCLWLAAFSSLDQFTVLMNERNVYPELNAADLIFAQYQAELDRLVVAGQAGIFVYDVNLHAWEKIFGGNVTTTLPYPVGIGFFVGYVGGVGFVDDKGFVPLCPLEGQTVVKLLQPDTQELLALTERTAQRAVYSVSLAGACPPTLVFETSSTNFDPAEFANALAIENTVLFTGPEGVTLHNVAARLFQDIAKDLLPRWLTESDTQLVNAGDTVFAMTDLDSSSGSYYALPPTGLVTPSYLTGDLTSAQAQPLPGPVTQSWGWDKNSIGILGEEKSIFRLEPQRAVRLTGAPLPELDTTRFLDAAMLGNDLYLATLDRVLRYDGKLRDWDTSVRLPDNTSAVELVEFGGQILARTPDGELIRVGSDPKVLIHSDALQMDNAGLSDVLSFEEGLFLAGEGRVDRYDLNERRITTRWQLVNASGKVRLHGIVNGLPLSQAENHVYLGDDILDDTAGAVKNVSLDDAYIWTVRELDGTRYLKGYDWNSGGERCFYRTPATSGDVLELADAKRLSNGIVVVLTNAGLWFYSPEAHSWYPGPADVPKIGGRLYLLGKYLVIAQPRGDETHLTFVPQDSISIPHSCAREPVRFGSQNADATAIAIDQAGGRVAWLDTGGAVLEWNDGPVNQVLPGSTSGPASKDLRRVFKRDTYLLFTTTDAIWKYEIRLRQWTRITLRGIDLNRLTDINIERENEIETVTARTNDGYFHLGTFRPGGDVSVQLNPILESIRQTFGTDAIALLDVQSRGQGLWTFLLEDRIRYFDPRARQWLDGAEFDARDSSLQFGQIAGWSVATGQNGDVWWVSTQDRLHPTEFVKYIKHPLEKTALDSNGAVWRLQPNGSLLRCTRSFTESDCKLAAPETFYLNSNQVRTAYIWRGIEIFETATGMRAFDPNTNSEIALPPELAQLTFISERRLVGNELWLYRPNDLFIVTMGTNSTVQARATTNVRQLVLDDGNKAWVQIQDEWFEDRNGEWVSPQTLSRKTASESGIRLFPGEGSITTAIDNEGALYYWTNGLAQTGWHLPKRLAVGEVSALYRNNDTSWWAQLGTRLYHIGRSACVITPTPAPAPTAQATQQPSPTKIAAQPTTLASPSASPSPTPTPTTEPCLVIDWEGTWLDASTGSRESRIKFARPIENGGIEFWNDAGSNLQIELDPNSVFQMRNGVNLPLALQAVPTNEWQRLSQFIVLANGRPAFNPITNLETTNTGNLVAVRPRSDVNVGAQGGLALEPIPALNVGWLVWERTPKRQFMVTTPNGNLAMEPSQFIRNGALPFEGVQAILAFSANRIFTASASGIMMFRNPSLALDDPAVTFQPISLAAPLSAVRGQIRTQNGQLAPGDASQQALTSEFGFNLDDAELVETIETQQVRGVVRTQSGLLNALTDTGFIWDDQRRGLAYQNGALVLQSDVGIGVVNRFAGYYAEPGSNLAGHLVSEANGVYYTANGTWYVRQNNVWSPSGDPASSRSLFQDDRWVWTYQNGQVQVALNANPYNFSADFSSGGYGFSTDRLRAAATMRQPSDTGSRLYVATDAFAQMGATVDELATWRAARLAPISTDLFDTFTSPGMQTRLLRRVSGAVSEWDAASGQFRLISSSSDPELYRLLVESNRLRFRLVNGRVVKELGLDPAAGAGGWVEFELVDRRFPFDRVTSLAIFENQLQLGTAAGLQVYGAPLNPGINAMIHLWDLRGGGGLPASITRVGVPVTESDLLMVQSSTACIERRINTSFSACRQAGQLASRLRLRNEFWEWLQDDNDERMHGQYRNAQGLPLPNEISPSEGRLPHDHIKQVVICQNRATTLWENGWVTVFSGTGLELPARVQTFSFEDAPLRLSCIEREGLLAAERVPAGLYLENASNRVMMFDGSGWAQVPSSGVAAEVKDRVARPRVFDHARFRLLQSDTEFRFEQQTLGGEWRPVPWKQGHLEIDEWSQFVIAGGKMWAATLAGLGKFQRDGIGRAVLDPETFALIREPDVQGSPCAISELTVMAEQVLARCNSNSQQVYEGMLDDTRDQNVFTRSGATDPFAEQELVNQETGGKWTWRRVGFADASQGYLTTTLDTRALELVSGRFEFDAVTTTAFYTEKLVDLATRAGRWQVPLNSFSTLQWQNPVSAVDATAVTDVFQTRVGDEIVLCFQLAEGGFERALPSGVQKLDECNEYLGQDTLWVYERIPTGLQMSGKEMSVAASAPSRRELVQGRFTDDIVIGMPVVGQLDASRAYWIPTRAGITRLDDSLSSVYLFSPPFAGLAPNVTPTSLLLLLAESENTDAGTQTPIYLAPDGIYSVSSKTHTASLASNALGGREPLFLERGPLQSIRLGWTDSGQRGWTLLDPTTFGVLGANSLTIDTRTFEDYQWVESNCNQDPTNLKVQFGSADISVNTLNPFPINDSKGFNLQTIVHVRDRVYIVGQYDIQEMNLGSVLRRVCGLQR